jgi:hypothetical protein
VRLSSPYENRPEPNFKTDFEREVMKIAKKDTAIGQISIKLLTLLGEKPLYFRSVEYSLETTV